MIGLVGIQIIGLDQVQHLRLHRLVGLQDRLVEEEEDLCSMTRYHPKSFLIGFLVVVVWVDLSVGLRDKDQKPPDC